LVAAKIASVPVRLIDTNQASIDKGLKFADKLLEKDVAKQRITKDEAVAARERLTTSTSMDDLNDVDFVIEAVPVRFAQETRTQLRLIERRKFQN
jgi:3-hydroxybutyryl-CoA dehydrogenase